MKNKKLVGIIVFIMVILAVLLVSSTKESYAAEITPTENQYIELKLVSTEPIAGAGTQAILELWAYNITLKGFDARFSYNPEEVTPSNITTNIETTGEDYFAFENGFGGFLGKLPQAEQQSNVLRCIIALNPIFDEDGNSTYESTNEYLKSDETLGDYVDSTGGVLIGKFSFLLKDGAEIDDETFALVDSETNSPRTGIEIGCNKTDYYSNPSTFRITTITTGTVSGSITTKNSSGVYNATIKAYPVGIVDWANLNGHTTLDTITPTQIVNTNNDGTYLIELEQGTYDILIDKSGYLDHIYANVAIVKGTDVALGVKSLVPGDVNKDGFIKLEDISLFNQHYGINSTLPNYDIKYDYNEDGYIKLEDISIFNQNYSSKRQIEEKGENNE